jgi:tRNA(Ile)-lysidine synthase
LGPLVVAHLNHQLRGNESAADESFVRSLHAQLADGHNQALRFHCGHENVATRAREERGNLEAVARRVRYEWLVDVANQEQVRFVATGHTANDQAETVLHRLLRGAGLKGLRGIAPMRKLAANVDVVRPMLQTTRAEILAYLDRHGQAYREDSSNRNLGHMRNRIRHELLPRLAQDYNPEIIPVLCRLAEQAGARHRRMATSAAALLAAAELPQAGSILVFDRQRLALASRPQLRGVFRLAWARQGWPEQAMGFDHWDRLAAVASGEMTAVDLPGGIRARLRGRVVQLGPVS